MIQWSAVNFAMNSNTGHGHVFPRPDGIKARCGGPALCSQCARDYARKYQEAQLMTMSVYDQAKQILQYFGYEHLTNEGLQSISKPFGVLAREVADRSPDNPEMLVALRKLLEAKDAAVRAGLG